MNNQNNPINLIDYKVIVDNKKNQLTDKRIQKQLKRFQTRVGILDASLYAMKPRFGEYIAPKKNPEDEPFDHKVLKGSRTRLKLKKLAGYIDKRYKIFSKPSRFKKSIRYQKAINYLTDFLFRYDPTKNKPPIEIIKKRWLSEVAASMRVSISERIYGNHSVKWAQKKGFQHLMVATGTFFKNIRAKLIKG